ncbi:hypothetical protein ACNKU7_18710 [Microbulbifer sp. SA54]|uniref:hypothetical protein n=1 Tax=Microbulbifer sp. SA54 TaxID=3401577 RepID=UPI003AAD08F8
MVETIVLLALLVIFSLPIYFLLFLIYRDRNPSRKFILFIAGALFLYGGSVGYLYEKIEPLWEKAVSDINTSLVNLKDESERINSVLINKEYDSEEERKIYEIRKVDLDKQISQEEGKSSLAEWFFPLQSLLEISVTLFAINIASNYIASATINKDSTRNFYEIPNDINRKIESLESAVDRQSTVILILVVFVGALLLWS